MRSYRIEPLSNKPPHTKRGRGLPSGLKEALESLGAGEALVEMTHGEDISGRRSNLVSIAQKMGLEVHTQVVYDKGEVWVWRG